MKKYWNFLINATYLPEYSTKKIEMSGSKINTEKSDSVMLFKSFQLNLNEVVFKLSSVSACIQQCLLFLIFHADSISTHVHHTATISLRV